MKINIFVYGTLMKGMSNHKYLSNSKFIGNIEVDGYKMYDLGNYPGVVRDKGVVKGEIYEIDEETLRIIDRLVDNEVLFIREKIYVGNLEMYIYVYMGNVDNKRIIPYEMQPYNNLIYYVSYGSNMLEERFLTYIRGGVCYFNNVNYSGCNNKHLPIKTKSVKIPYNMFYSKKSKSWNNSSICFLDVTEKGFAYARAYLITRQQFKEIQVQEGKAYNKMVKLDNIDGFKAYTFTTNDKTLEHKDYSTLKDEYKYVLMLGLQESFPNLNILNFEKYLYECSK